MDREVWGNDYNEWSGYSSPQYAPLQMEKVGNNYSDYDYIDSIDGAGIYNYDKHNPNSLLTGTEYTSDVDAMRKSNKLAVENYFMADRLKREKFEDGGGGIYIEKNILIFIIIIFAVFILLTFLNVMEIKRLVMMLAIKHA